ncbi:MAG: hypothetical protein CO023_05825 [Flavobacteriales bacterium CG_4_9_14_0_2_um_filter_35_242]|nr:hypothetical protein [Zetaproteobacteria bacterium]NDK17933.1 hypothetical protein [Flavobacteriales bacterium]OIO12331.1 MAG: hypothetical protein AUJ53_02605 [Flavobacteriaceae bacterium CG1_02_35_72]PIV17387.1 MAG: hypothetical protein COS42_05105 [Flavobacteriales bacterium CG03_land_8_20_14_0_80_35_15]PIX07746.1 MAG: hypothetical protein COZ76_01795 [Flavobacteriales bacterium CG_4_8_14_3_um_filter_35_10]PJA04735.1 MAG: hypothetical protein COX71_10245 [Flavobacteriales bacterium CG_4_
MGLNNYIELFIYMLGSFLIGYGFAYYYYKQKFDKLNSSFGARHIDDKLEEVVIGKINAKKTFERGGKEVEENRQSQIDFFVEEPIIKPKANNKKKPPKKA